MATFVLIPGAASGPWYWHLVEAELERLGHRSVAVELPCDDDSAGLDEYVAAAQAAIDAAGSPTDLAVVAHSFGGFTGTLLASRVPAELLVLLTAMVPRPGESPGDWWGNTGLEADQRAQHTADGIPPDVDPSEAHVFYNGVSPELMAGAEADGRAQSDAPAVAPWPLDAWPDVPTRFVVCTEDRFFPEPFMRRLAADRLAADTPIDTLPAGHLPMLSHPTELAALLDHAWTHRTT